VCFWWFFSGIYQGSQRRPRLQRRSPQEMMIENSRGWGARWGCARGMFAACTRSIRPGRRVATAPWPGEHGRAPTQSHPQPKAFADGSPRTMADDIICRSGGGGGWLPPMRLEGRATGGDGTPIDAMEKLGADRQRHGRGDRPLIRQHHTKGRRIRRNSSYARRKQCLFSFHRLSSFFSFFCKQNSMFDLTALSDAEGMPACS